MRTSCSSLRMLWVPWKAPKAAVQTLVDQGVPAIVGIGISTHLEQAFPIAQENGVVAFSPISSAAGLSSLGDYIFRAGLAVDILNPVGLRTTQAQLGYTKSCDDTRCRRYLLHE